MVFIFEQYRVIFLFLLYNPVLSNREVSTNGFKMLIKKTKIFFFLEKIIFNIVLGIYSQYLLTHPYKKARLLHTGLYYLYPFICNKHRLYLLYEH